LGKGALIIGGSAAGLQAALDLADSGIKVHLVEPSPFVGNRPARGPAAAIPRHVWNARLLEISKHTNITLWTNSHVTRVGGEAGGFHVELRRHPRYVDLNKCTACEDCLTACPVTVPGTEHKAIYLAGGAQPGCAVIDKQGKAPCSNTCPGGIHVQGYVALIAQGRFREALSLIHQSIPFPGICGRICTHPCELNCRRAEVDQAVAIRLLKRFVADWEVAHPDEAQEEQLPSPAPDAKRVAVIGAGPAGMAVAQDLARKGYRVTVFEALPVVGGMMAVGIPTYRLPRDVIRREIKRIERLGVEIRTNTPIGPDGAYTLDDLFGQGYEAIFVGVGAHHNHELKIPGEDLRGVVSGIALLKAVNLAHQTGEPQWQMRVLSYLLGGVATRVAIVGGGNTAMDVARSLKRLGVEDVHILYRRTRAEMPALPEEIEEAEHEGVPIEFLVAPVRIMGNEQGRVVALECVRMKLGEPDHSGRRRPVPIAGSEFSLDVDMVVPAIGQFPDLAFLGEGHGFAITREGTFNVDRVSYMTNRPGVFAAGDAITQPVSVIDAIGSAKQAAAGIDAYLRGVPAQEIPVSSREVPIARRTLLPEELVAMPRLTSSTIPMAQRMHSYVEVELGYDAETAIAEAQRCLSCGPCSECLACEKVCEPGAIIHGQQEQLQELEVGAILLADEQEANLGALPSWASDLRKDNGHDRQGIYQVGPDDPLAGSAVAAQVMVDLFAEQRPAEAPAPMVSLTGAARIGVFICQCNGQISEVVNTAALDGAAAAWKDVAYTQVLAQSCSSKAAGTIHQAAAEHSLNRVVLAACSCCAVDQVCYSCTYQRVRCKDSLLGQHFDRGDPLFEFVNIREECAWAHDDDPEAATAVAAAMIAAAVAKTRVSVLPPQVSAPLDKTVLIVGNGQAATVCQEVLSAQQIQAPRLKTVPRQIRQTQGHFAILDGSAPWQGSALVLAPQDAQEYGQIQAAFDTPGRQPRARVEWGGAGTHRPGIFVCDPAVDPGVAGMATAARVTAWLAHEHTWPEAAACRVDSARCRGCGDCELVCEFGAIQLQGEGDARVAWIDPLICQGDGICAPRCPAGAIQTGHLTGEQIAAMLDAILA
jgi:NADPH-dependent glutamate synthase beta subunit-like oxidoreductase/NAD-dependent dihydropyrimidine dehydrogenase PreA subunit